MKKPYYVLCHMITTIDGRIAGDFLSSKIFEPFSPIFYDTLAELDVNNWICGRVTFEADVTSSAPLDLTDYQERKVPREDFIAPEAKGRFAIAIDPSGKLNYEKNYSEVDNNRPTKDYIVSVLSEQVSDAYLAFLQDKGISYLFAGKEKPLSMETVLDKLHQYFGIERFFVAGGGYVNGSFLSEDLIDEISSVVTPIVEGKTSSPSFFEYGASHLQNPKAFKISQVEKRGEDVLWIRYVKNR